MTLETEQNRVNMSNKIEIIRFMYIGHFMSSLQNAYSSREVWLQVVRR